MTTVFRAHDRVYYVGVAWPSLKGVEGTVLKDNGGNSPVHVRFGDDPVDRNRQCLRESLSYSFPFDKGEALINPCKEIFLKNIIRINTVAITALASSKADDLSKFDSLPLDIKEVLARKTAEATAKRAEDAADSILQLFERAEYVTQEHVAGIRLARKRIEESKKYIGELEAARAFGSKTMNFVPMLALMGLVNPVDNKEAMEAFEAFRRGEEVTKKATVVRKR